MAFDKITLVNSNTGETKIAPVGFSWTTFCFSGIPALIRGDWKNGGIMLLCALITSGIANFVFCFMYNKMYIKELVFKQGFKATACESNNWDRVTKSLGFNLPRT